MDRTEWVRLLRGFFFGRIYGAPGLVELCKLEARRLGEPPETIAAVRDLLHREGWEPPSELPQLIRDLETHCYQDADKTRVIAHAELVKVAVGFNPKSWGVPLLAVYGSALRMTGDCDAAQQALVAALEIAERHGDLSTLGDLLLRLADVVADLRGDYRRALLLTEGATDRCLQAGDLHCVGKTFMARGLWLYKLGRFEEAVRMRRRALEDLEGDELHSCCYGVAPIQPTRPPRPWLGSSFLLRKGALSPRLPL